MEISVLKALLNNISSFFRLSSCENLNSEPALTYLQKIEEILKLLKPVLDAIVDSEVASDEFLIKAYEELGLSVDELRELFEGCHPLKSKVCFVLQIESLMLKLRTSGLDIFQSLISFHQHLPDELSSASLELCIQKIKHTGYDKTSGVIKEAIKNQVEGGRPSSESLVKIADCMNLKSNQEILIEAVALEKLKENAEQTEKTVEAEYIDQMIALVTHIHDRYITIKQSQSYSHVTIPADFCCPLSLELMTDPVIVASGQTYERAFIKNWIDRGLTVCPKTRQTLAHTNLIPHYSVKALIANWCECNNVKLPDPVKSMNLTQSSPLHYHAESGAHRDSHNVPQSRGDQQSSSSYSSDASGEVITEPPAAATLASLQREPQFVPRLETRTRSQTIWRRPSERFLPRIVSSPFMETRPDLFGIETQVRKLIDDLNNTSLDAQREATSDIRFLAKQNMENRITIANCGAISLLVDLLRSPDTKIQENAVTALLNLSINVNNKTSIASANAIEPLIYVLETGSPKAKEKSAATLFSLSVIEDNKVRIGRFGAIGPLVDLLGNGTPRGKKYAATALSNLSIFHENKARIVQAGAVKYLVELMDPAAGMVDKAVAVLANLATIQEGRTAIGQEGGIPVLVEVVELGSARGKENAAAALLQLCTNSNRFCSMVLQEGAVPPLVALSQSGTPRAKEKAQALLSYFRNQRHGNAGRAKKGLWGSGAHRDSHNIPQSRGDLQSSSSYCSDASGEVITELLAVTTLASLQREPEFLPELERRTRSQTIWHCPSERFLPSIVSSPAMETRPDLSGIKTHIWKLMDDLNSTSLDAQREATAEVRLLAKHNMDNRIDIAYCGAISLLVNLLRSPDTRIQENAVTALLNLSINDNNKISIASANAIEPLIYVLETGSPEAEENSAATLCSLSVIEGGKVSIGRAGAIHPLVDLLGNGTPRGKKDAATALFNLSIFHENKARIVQAGAVKYLVELMDPAAGMVDTAVAVLDNLATIQEGRTAIVQEGGIPVLVEVVELGSAKGKENAAAALLQLCRNSSRLCSMVLQEGSFLSLVALSQSGTPRAKEKAQALLSYFRNQRHGNAGRAKKGLWSCFML